METDRAGANQDAFLDRVASKLGRNRRSAIQPPFWQNKPYRHLVEGFNQEELNEQFISSLASLNTKVDRVSKADLPETFRQVIAKFETQAAMYWDDSRLYELGIGEILTEAGMEHRAWDPSCDEQELRSFAARADMGITFADAGLAETGTVLLMNGGGRGRLVSLLPPVYVVILNEESIVPRLTQGVAYVQERVKDGLPACINFISGPSRTGDIEGDLSLGVHGPGKVHVLLLKN